MTEFYLDPKEEFFFKMQRHMNEMEETICAKPVSLPDFPEELYAELFDKVQTLRPTAFTVDLKWPKLKDLCVTHLSEVGYLYDAKTNAFHVIQPHHSRRPRKKKKRSSSEKRMRKKSESSATSKTKQCKAKCILSMEKSKQEPLESSGDMLSLWRKLAITESVHNTGLRPETGQDVAKKPGQMVSDEIEIAYLVGSGTVKVAMATGCKSAGELESGEREANRDRAAVSRVEDVSLMDVDKSATEVISALTEMVGAATLSEGQRGACTDVPTRNNTPVICDPGGSTDGLRESMPLECSDVTVNEGPVERGTERVTLTGEQSLGGMKLHSREDIKINADTITKTPAVSSSLAANIDSVFNVPCEQHSTEKTTKTKTKAALVKLLRQRTVHGAPGAAVHTNSSRQLPQDTEQSHVVDINIQQPSLYAKTELSLDSSSPYDETRHFNEIIAAEQCGSGSLNVSVCSTERSHSPQMSASVLQQPQHSDTLRPVKQPTSDLESILHQCIVNTLTESRSKRSSESHMSHDNNNTSAEITAAPDGAVCCDKSTEDVGYIAGPSKNVIEQETVNNIGDLDSHACISVTSQVQTVVQDISVPSDVTATETMLKSSLPGGVVDVPASAQISSDLAQTSELQASCSSSNDHNMASVECEGQQNVAPVVPVLSADAQQSREVPAKGINNTDVGRSVSMKAEYTSRVNTKRAELARITNGHMTTPTRRNSKSGHMSEEDESTDDGGHVTFKCRFCKRVFESLSRRRQHQEWVCSLRADLVKSGPGENICLVCGASFKKKTGLNRHVSRMHPEAISTDDEAVAKQKLAKVNGMKTKLPGVRMKKAKMRPVQGEVGELIGRDSKHTLDAPRSEEQLTESGRFDVRPGDQYDGYDGSTDMSAHEDDNDAGAEDTSVDSTKMTVVQHHARGRLKQLRRSASDGNHVKIPGEFHLNQCTVRLSRLSADAIATYQKDDVTKPALVSESSNPGELPSLCDLCGAHCLDVGMLEDHFLDEHHVTVVLSRRPTAENEVFLCEFCGDAFVRPSRLRAHMIKLHNNATKPIMTAGAVHSGNLAEVQIGGSANEIVVRKISDLLQTASKPNVVIQHVTVTNDTVTCNARTDIQVTGITRAGPADTSITRVTEVNTGNIESDKQPDSSQLDSHNLDTSNTINKTLVEDWQCVEVVPVQNTEAVHWCSGTNKQDIPHPCQSNTASLVTSQPPEVARSAIAVHVSGSLITRQGALPQKTGSSVRNRAGEFTPKIRTVDVEKFVCGMCLDEFGTSSAFECHRNETHHDVEATVEVTQTFICQFCGYACGNIYRCHEHVSHAHSGDSLSPDKTSSTCESKNSVSLQKKTTSSSVLAASVTRPKQFRNICQKVSSKTTKLKQGGSTQVFHTNGQGGRVSKVIETGDTTALKGSVQYRNISMFAVNALVCRSCHQVYASAQLPSQLHQCTVCKGSEPLEATLMYQCLYCEQVFETKQACRFHEITKCMKRAGLPMYGLARGVFTCDICKRSYSRRQDLKRHLKKQNHGSDMMIKQAALITEQMSGAMVINRPSNTECITNSQRAFAGVTSATTSELGRHQCPTCSLSFTAATPLKLHILNEHGYARTNALKTQMRKTKLMTNDIQKNVALQFSIVDKTEGLPGERIAGGNRQTGYVGRGQTNSARSATRADQFSIHSVQSENVGGTSPAAHIVSRPSLPVMLTTKNVGMLTNGCDTRGAPATGSLPVTTVWHSTVGVHAVSSGIPAEANSTPVETLDPLHNSHQNEALSEPECTDVTCNESEDSPVKEDGLPTSILAQLADMLSEQKDGENKGATQHHDEPPSGDSRNLIKWPPQQIQFLLSETVEEMQRKLDGQSHVLVHGDTSPCTQHPAVLVQDVSVIYSLASDHNYGSRFSYDLPGMAAPGTDVDSRVAGEVCEGVSATTDLGVCSQMLSTVEGLQAGFPSYSRQHVVGAVSGFSGVIENDQTGSQVLVLVPNDMPVTDDRCVDCASGNSLLIDESHAGSIRGQATVADSHQIENNDREHTGSTDVGERAQTLTDRALSMNVLSGDASIICLSGETTAANSEQRETSNSVSVTQFVPGQETSLSKTAMPPPGVDASSHPGLEGHRNSVNPGCFPGVKPEKGDSSGMCIRPAESRTVDVISSNHGDKPLMYGLDLSRTVCVKLVPVKKTVDQSQVAGVEGAMGGNMTTSRRREYVGGQTAVERTKPSLSDACVQASLETCVITADIDCDNDTHETCNDITSPVSGQDSGTAEDSSVPTVGGTNESEPEEITSAAEALSVTVGDGTLAVVGDILNLQTVNDNTVTCDGNGVNTVDDGTHCMLTDMTGTIPDQTVNSQDTQSVHTSSCDKDSLPDEMTYGTLSVIDEKEGLPFDLAVPEIANTLDQTSSNNNTLDAWISGDVTVEVEVEEHLHDDNVSIEDYLENSVHDGNVSNSDVPDHLEGEPCAGDGKDEGDVALARHDITDVHPPNTHPGPHTSDNDILMTSQCDILDNNIMGTDGENQRENVVLSEETRSDNLEVTEDATNSREEQVDNSHAVITVDLERDSIELHTEEQTDGFEMFTTGGNSVCCVTTETDTNTRQIDIQLSAPVRSDVLDHDENEIPKEDISNNIGVCVSVTGEADRTQETSQITLQPSPLVKYSERLSLVADYGNSPVNEGGDNGDSPVDESGDSTVDEGDDNGDNLLHEGDDNGDSPVDESDNNGDSPVDGGDDISTVDELEQVMSSGDEGSIVSRVKETSPERDVVDRFLNVVGELEENATPVWVDSPGELMDLAVRVMQSGRDTLEVITDTEVETTAEEESNLAELLAAEDIKSAVDEEDFVAAGESKTAVDEVTELVAVEETETIASDDRARAPDTLEAGLGSRSLPEENKSSSADPTTEDVTVVNLSEALDSELQTAVGDDSSTPKTLDDSSTPKTLDDSGTPKTLDDSSTPKTLDDSGTSKTLDDIASQEKDMEGSRQVNTEEDIRTTVMLADLAKESTSEVIVSSELAWNAMNCDVDSMQGHEPCTIAEESIGRDLFDTTNDIVILVDLPDVCMADEELCGGLLQPPKRLDPSGELEKDVNQTTVAISTADVVKTNEEAATSNNDDHPPSSVKSEGRKSGEMEDAADSGQAQPSKMVDMPPGEIQKEFGSRQRKAVVKAPKYRCEHCMPPLSFSSRCSFQLHQKIVHNIRSDCSEDRMPKEALVCPICHGAPEFNEELGLQCHMKWLHGVNNFSLASSVAQSGVSASSEGGSVTKGVDEMTQGVDEVTQGVDEVTQGVDEVTQGVDEMTQGVDEMTQGVDEMTQGVDKVTQGVDEVTQGVHEMTQGVDAEHMIEEDGGLDEDVTDVELADVTQDVNDSLESVSSSTLANVTGGETETSTVVSVPQSHQNTSYKPDTAICKTGDDTNADQQDNDDSVVDHREVGDSTAGRSDCLDSTTDSEVQLKHDLTTKKQRGTRVTRKNGRRQGTGSGAVCGKHNKQRAKSCGQLKLKSVKTERDSKASQKLVLTGGLRTRSGIVLPERVPPSRVLKVHKVPLTGTDDGAVDFPSSVKDRSESGQCVVTSPRKSRRAAVQRHSTAASGSLGGGLRTRSGVVLPERIPPCRLVASPKGQVKPKSDIGCAAEGVQGKYSSCTGKVAVKKGNEVVPTVGTGYGLTTRSGIVLPERIPPSQSVNTKPDISPATADAALPGNVVVPSGGIETLSQHESFDTGETKNAEVESPVEERARCVPPKVAGVVVADPGDREQHHSEEPLPEQRKENRDSAGVDMRSASVSSLERPGDHPAIVAIFQNDVLRGETCGESPAPEVSGKILTIDEMGRSDEKSQSRERKRHKKRSCRDLAEQGVVDRAVPARKRRSHAPAVKHLVKHARVTETSRVDADSRNSTETIRESHDTAEAVRVTPAAPLSSRSRSPHMTLRVVHTQGTGGAGAEELREISKRKDEAVVNASCLTAEKELSCCRKARRAGRRCLHRRSKKAENVTDVMPSSSKSPDETECRHVEKDMVTTGSSSSAVRPEDIVDLSHHVRLNDSSSKPCPWNEQQPDTNKTVSLDVELAEPSENGSETKSSCGMDVYVIECKADDAIPAGAMSASSVAGDAIQETGTGSSQEPQRTSAATVSGPLLETPHPLTGLVCECQLCGEQYARRCLLERHMVRLHKRKVTSWRRLSDQTETLIATDLLWRCVVCGMQFLMFGAYRSHTAAEHDVTSPTEHDVTSPTEHDVTSPTQRNALGEGHVELDSDVAMEDMECTDSAVEPVDNSDVEVKCSMGGVESSYDRETNVDLTETHICDSVTDICDTVADMCDTVTKGTSQEEELAAKDDEELALSSPLPQSRFEMAWLKMDTRSPCVSDRRPVPNSSLPWLQQKPWIPQHNVYFGKRSKQTPGSGVTFSSDDAQELSDNAETLQSLVPPSETDETSQSLRKPAVSSRAITKETSSRSSSSKEKCSDLSVSSRKVSQRERKPRIRHSSETRSMSSDACQTKVDTDRSSSDRSSSDRSSSNFTGHENSNQKTKSSTRRSSGSRDSCSSTAAEQLTAPQNHPTEQPLDHARSSQTSIQCKTKTSKTRLVSMDADQQNVQTVKLSSKAKRTVRSVSPPHSSTCEEETRSRRHSESRTASSAVDAKKERSGSPLSKHTSVESTKKTKSRHRHSADILLVSSAVALVSHAPRSSRETWSSLLATVEPRYRHRRVSATSAVSQVKCVTSEDTLKSSSPSRTRSVHITKRSRHKHTSKAFHPLKTHSQRTLPDEKHAKLRTMSHDQNRRSSDVTSCKNTVPSRLLAHIRTENSASRHGGSCSHRSSNSSTTSPRKSTTRTRRSSSDTFKSPGDIRTVTAAPLFKSSDSQENNTYNKTKQTSHLSTCVEYSQSSRSCSRDVVREKASLSQSSTVSRPDKVLLGECQSHRWKSSKRDGRSSRDSPHKVNRHKTKPARHKRSASEDIGSLRRSSLEAVSSVSSSGRVKSVKRGSRASGTVSAMSAPSTDTRTDDVETCKTVAQSSGVKHSNAAVTEETRSDATELIVGGRMSKRRRTLPDLFGVPLNSSYIT